MHLSQRSENVQVKRFLPPANEVWVKVMFSDVFDYPQGGSLYDVTFCLWTETPPGTVESGRYASYWNAFLLQDLTFVVTFLHLYFRKKRMISETLVALRYYYLLLLSVVFDN